MTLASPNPSHVPGPKATKVKQASSPSYDPATNPVDATNQVWRAGRFVIFIFFGIGGLLAAFAPLQVAIVTGGKVATDGGRYFVQSSSDGSVREVRVQDGAKVQRGDTVMVLEDVQAQSGFRIELERVRMLAAIEARLIAERAGRSSLVFNHPALHDKTDPEVVRLQSAQSLQLQSELARRSARTAVLRQRISQLEAQIEGERQQKAITKGQIDIVRDQINSLEPLLAKGFATKKSYLDLKQAEAALTSGLVAHDNTVLRLNEAIGEVRLELISLQSETVRAVNSELEKIQLDRAVAEQTLTASRDRLARTEIKAPETGTVNGLAYKALGAVVRAAEPLMEIVPTDDKLVIEAQVRLKDIDDIRPGQSVRIVFSGLPRVRPHETHGEVSFVPASAISDQKSQESFYKVVVVVNKDRLSKDVPGLELVAGMPAEVYFLSGQRTLLDYVIEPVVNVFRRGLTER